MINAETIMLYAIPVFFILIGVELLAGLWMQRKFYRLSDAVANISCGITQQVSGAIFKLFGLGLYLFLYQNARLFDMPNNWGIYILLFVLIDMLYYWFHRYSHEINTFWGAHVVHHQSEEYNLSVALRQSAFQGFFSAVFYLPLAIVGFDPIPFAIINTFQTLYQFWIHTEAIDKLPFWFEYIFNTPSHHRVHHGRNPEYIDKNHGGTLIIFDRLFGTFEPERAPVVYGVTKSLGSWNPIWANFDYYSDLVKESARIPRFVDKVRLWVDRPGWLPQELGGQQTVPPCDRETQQKYNVSIPKVLLWYSLVHFTTMLMGATGFLMMVGKLEIQHSLLLAVMILWTAANIGALLDRRSWAIWSELLRFVGIPLSIYLIWGLNPVLWGVLGFMGLSGVWMVLLKNSR
jgi:sterol desaturase/sphingolipid hydroxylase (fatty acid hydroxylase superfamily)